MEVYYSQWEEKGNCKRQNLDAESTEKQEKSEIKEKMKMIIMWSH